MDNPFQQQSFVNWLLGGVMTLLTVLTTLFGKRVDTLEAAHRDMLKSYVTREELDKHMTTIAQVRAEQHLENGRKLERIEDSISKLRDQLNQAPYRAHDARTRRNDS